MSNYRTNKAAIDKFRKELKAMMGDISEIDSRVLTQAVNEGLADAKRNTPVGQYPPSSGRVGGFLRKSWSTTPTQKTSTGVQKEMINTAHYAIFVNYGHRVVNRKGETVGWVPGKFILEKAIKKVDKALVRLFEKEVERVNRKHDR
jgi:hypothetical protein